MAERWGAHIRIRLQQIHIRPSKVRTKLSEAHIRLSEAHIRLEEVHTYKNIKGTLSEEPVYILKFWLTFIKFLEQNKHIRWSLNTVYRTNGEEFHASRIVHQTKRSAFHYEGAAKNQNTFAFYQYKLSTPWKQL